MAIRLIGVSYRSRRTELLDGIDLTITERRPTLILGPNGSGKTTLLRLMMGLIDPSRGSVGITSCGGRAPARRAFVFQKPVMLRRSAADNIGFALQAAGRQPEARTIAAILARVDLADVAARPARLLSGGEQQRLALARALARQPDVLFLDEPTASLDPAQTKAVEEIVGAIASEGVKIVMATHDLGQARRLAGEILFLVQGRIVEQSAAAGFFETPRTVQARRFLAGELLA